MATVPSFLAPAKPTGPSFSTVSKFLWTVTAVGLTAGALAPPVSALAKSVGKDEVKETGEKVYAMATPVMSAFGCISAGILAVIIFYTVHHGGVRY
jgi:hypothetical protein